MKTQNLNEIRPFSTETAQKIGRETRTEGMKEVFNVLSVFFNRDKDTQAGEAALPKIA